MARIVKQEDYDSRRNTILEAAQRLVYTKGYEQMSIQDILYAVQISKGAFYHYFNSKQALMEGLIERMSVQGVQVLAPIAHDEHLSATEKLLRMFDQGSRWKAARKDYLLTLVKVWYADENAVLRLKSQAAVISLVAPLFNRIISQGVEEGVFHTSHPEQASEIVFSLLQGMGDAMIKLLAQPELDAQGLEYLEELTASHQDAIERILGAQPGSLPLFDVTILREWFPLATDQT
ncbi:MAG TPA: TetR/AcrR family transcriptional regulator [Anaerolineales bacterium]